MRSYLIKYGVKEEVTYLGFFKVAEDTRFAVCSNCSKQVPRGGGNTKVFTTSNLVSHLRRHTEDYKKYEELKHRKKKKPAAKKMQENSPAVIQH